MTVMAEYVMKAQRPCGAIPQTVAQPYTANPQYGTGESPIIYATGDPATENGVPTDWHVDYHYLGGNQIALIPEPGMLVLLIGLALAMAGCRIRR